MVQLDSHWMRQVRRLTQFLIISTALNVLLVTTFIYYVVRDRSSTSNYESRPATRNEQTTPLADGRSKKEVVALFEKMPLEALVAKLNSTQLVEDGYTERDLALACLVSFQDFNLQKALPNQVVQQRQLVFGGGGSSGSIIIFPGLSNEAYQSISHYATTEKWPLTSKGLFTQLAKIQDSSLVEAFYQTPEFLAVEVLFSRAEVPVEKPVLLQLVQEGNWQVLNDFTQQQRTSQDLSPARRQRLLLDYMSLKSKTAACLMLRTDGEFAAKKLNDAQVITLLQLLTEKTPETEKFAIEILTSPRSDNVWQSAAGCLYTYAGETLPLPYDHMAALNRFVPQDVLNQKINMVKTTVEATEKPNEVKTVPLNVVKKNKDPAKIAATKKTTVAPKDKVYVVKEGDSLWSIAKRHNVDIEVLKKYNHMENDKIKPGKAIKIPAPVVAERP